MLLPSRWNQCSRRTRLGVGGGISKAIVSRLKIGLASDIENNHSTGASGAKRDTR